MNKLNSVVSIYQAIKNPHWYALIRGVAGVVIYKQKGRDSELGSGNPQSQLKFR